MTKTPAPVSVSQFDSLNVVVMPMSELTPHPENPRDISDETFASLVASIKRFGMYQLPVFNKRNGFLVAGHQRVKALASLGVDKVKVNVVDLDETAHYEMMMNDNNRLIDGVFTPGAFAILEKIEEGMTEEDFKALSFKGLRDFLSAVDGDWSVSEGRQAASEEGDGLSAIHLKCDIAEHEGVIAEIRETVMPKFPTLKVWRA